MKILLSIGIAVVCLASLEVSVGFPYRQNQRLRLAMHLHESRSDAAGGPRRVIELLEKDPMWLWDPYLRGVRNLHLARSYRRLGRSDIATEYYEYAVAGRTLPEVKLELALYQLELGEGEEALRNLSELVAFSSAWDDRIPPELLSHFE